MAQHSLLRALSVAIALVQLPAVSHAQLSARSAYVVIQRGDTLAIEESVSSGARTEAELVLPKQGIRWSYALQRTADERVAVMANEIRMLAAHPDAPPVQSSLVTFTGDSAILSIAGTEQRIRSHAGAIPFVNLSIASVQQIVRRARVVGGERVDVPVFIATNGQPMTARVERRGDTTTIDLAGVRLDAAVDAAGEITGAVVPTQDVRFVRATGAVDLRRPAPDYSAPEGAPYTARDVVITTPAGVKLAGTLTVPRGAAGTRAPAVVMISGSGPQDRDSELAIVSGYRPFRQIADTLGRRGIAVLRLDDRGIGGSDPGPSRATSADLADDVRAAVAWLRSQPEIDPRAIGLVGHSEGGLIAPLVASTDSTLAGIVIMAGPSQTGREILAHQQRLAVELDTTIAVEKRDSVRAVLRELTEATARRDPWIAYFMDHDPLAVAMNVNVPVLILHGETDRQVTVEQAAALGDAIRTGGNRDVTVRIFPETNHLFLHDPDGGWGGYSALKDSSVIGEVLGALADWIDDRFAKPRVAAPRK